MSQQENGKKTFYITTPIYYTSGKLHIGNAYTTVAADTITRYKKMRGYETYFLTGTDEHGQKIERVAKQNNVTPKQFVDGIVSRTKSLWKTLDIEYDQFIRTTDPFHKEAVQKIFKKLYEQGDIYKSEYEGLYCTPCEAFFTERQLKGGNCPDCGRSVEKIREESYFFKLSKYQGRLIEHIKENPDFIQPQSRCNEMLNNFLLPGLEDLCISRTSFKWGIPVDFDPGHVVYVWVDALSNYITALGYLSGDDSNYKKFWPADVHLVGKEIVRFHTIIWPIMLMAIGEPLPKQIFGHGWLLFGDSRMSKSKGNIIDPIILVEKFGVDAIRYFLLREIAFGQDGNFTNEALIQRINSDLANDLGNLLSRTAGMILKYFGQSLPEVQIGTEFDASVIELSKATVQNTETAMDKMFFSDALSEIWAFIRRMNKYIDETQPWVLARNDENKPQLAGVLYNLAEALRIISVLISPFMPNTPKAIWEQLNITDCCLKTWESTKTFGLLPKNVQITKGNIVFPRIDIKKELEETENNTQTEKVKEQPKKPVEEITEVSEITIDDFAKVKLKTGKILECKAVEGSDKLLCSQIEIGEETRQIVSGIAKYYKPEQLVGKNVVVVCNLKPVKLRGVVSQGMILCAEENGILKIITADGEIGSGAEVR